ncbi:MAG: NADAR family protein [Cyanobacteria bacterium P01_F01_bin.42]
MTIYFYKADEPYGCFSNFSPHPVVMDQLRWPTSEHYYQAQKFVGTTDAQLGEVIRQATTPEAAAALGRDCSRIVRADWEQVKCDVMYAVVRVKFQSHLEIQSLLLATGEQLLIENSPTDFFWGCGRDHNGKNHLGQILMRVREECRVACNQEKAPLNRRL